MLRISHKKLVLIVLVLLVALLFIVTDFNTNYELSKSSLEGFRKCMETANTKQESPKSKYASFDVKHSINNQKYTRIEFNKDSDDEKKPANDEFLATANDDNNQESGVLVLTLIQSRRSFGHSQKRRLSDFIDLLHSLEYPNRDDVSLGLLIGDKGLFGTIVKYFEQTEGLMFRRVVLLHAPFIKDSQTRRGNRHEARLQRVRRRQLARLRNFLMIRSFADELHVLWMDADIASVEDKRILLHFINSNKDIVVPRISEAANPDYDLNSWQGTRSEPDASQAKLMDANEWDKVTFAAEDVKVFHFSTFLKEQASDHREPDYAFPLDAVGGALLYVRLHILQQGVVFPAHHAVGTNWKRDEGYDGVESEGLCYVARVMGYKCWGMPNQVAVHAI